MFSIKATAFLRLIAIFLRALLSHLESLKHYSSLRGKLWRHKKQSAIPPVVKLREATSAFDPIFRKAKTNASPYLIAGDQTLTARNIESFVLLFVDILSTPTTTSEASHSPTID
jgi:hypothetical protein